MAETVKPTFQLLQGSGSKEVGKAYAPSELLGPLNQVEIKNAPDLLYAAGDVSLLRGGARVAIVGARKATEEGVRRARRLARELVQHGVVVVSGLAAGIDTAAHTGAIDGGGKTISVLGTSLNEVFPAQNRALQRRIIEHYLAISQFAPDTPVRPYNFPKRNRVMALISDATVIVEASDSSGTISQGWEALRLGRLLLIMKSVVENQALSWPAQMIAYGAQVLTSTEPLLEMLPFETAELASLAF